MTLEERYNAASVNTYVGRVKALQAADAGAIDGVNFMNGEGFTGKPPANDQVQTEFKRNVAGAFKYGGDGKVPGTYSLSRWLPKGLNKGDTYLTNTKFTTSRGTLIQKYNWLRESDTFIGKLANRTQNVVKGSASGPSPAGVNG